MATAQRHRWGVPQTNAAEGVDETLCDCGTARRFVKSKRVYVSVSGRKTKTAPRCKRKLE